MTNKTFKKKVKKVFTRDNINKAVIIVSGLALLATSILPYVL